MGGIAGEKYDVYYTDEYDYDPTNYDVVDNYTVIQELDSSSNKTSNSMFLKMMQKIVKNALKEFKSELKKEMVAEQTELIKDIAAVMNSDSSDNEDDL